MSVAEIDKKIENVDHLKHETSLLDPRIKSCVIPSHHRVNLIRSRQDSHELKKISRKTGISFILS